MDSIVRKIASCLSKVFITWESAPAEILSILVCNTMRAAPLDLLIALSTSREFTLEVPSHIGKAYTLVVKYKRYF